MNKINKSKIIKLESEIMRLETERNLYHKELGNLRMQNIILFILLVSVMGLALKLYLS